MKYVEIEKGSSWITFSKDACQLMGIKTKTPILVYSVKQQEKVFCFEIRPIDEIDIIALGAPRRPTQFSRKMTMDWIYPPEPEYMMDVLGYKNDIERYELKTKDSEYGTLFYIGEWKE